MKRVRSALIVAGFACLCGAAWMLARPAGLAATGVALLVLEALSGPDEQKGQRDG